MNVSLCILLYQCGQKGFQLVLLFKKFYSGSYKRNRAGIAKKKKYAFKQDLLQCRIKEGVDCTSIFGFCLLALLKLPNTWSCTLNPWKKVVYWQVMWILFSFPKMMLLSEIIKEQDMYQLLVRKCREKAELVDQLLFFQLPSIQPQHVSNVDSNELVNIATTIQLLLKDLLQPVIFCGFFALISLSTQDVRTEKIKIST